MSVLYAEAGGVVDAVLHDKVGLKQALYRKKLENTRAVCKLAMGVLGQKTALREALRSCGVIAANGRAADSKPKAQKGKASTGKTFEVAARREGMALVMAFDLLAGRGLSGGGQLKRTILARRADIEAAFLAAGGTKAAAAGTTGGGAKEGDAGGTEGESKGSDKLSAVFAALPRYVRINRLLVPKDEDVAALRQKLADVLCQAAEKQAGTEDPMQNKLFAEVASDALVPQLLRLHPRARPWLHGLPDVDRGALVLQDRSSCLAALAAGITPGTSVLDACAAPGSKTAHAIELLQGRGRMVACERQLARARALISRLRLLAGLQPAVRRDTGAAVVCSAKEGQSTKKRKKKRGGQESSAAQSESADGEAKSDEAPQESLPSGNRKEPPLKTGAVRRFRAATRRLRVEVRVGDFLKCKPRNFRDVEVLLVDPSCSGSGLPEHHLSASGPTKVGAQRLRKLAAFQCRILQHALRFPKARTVVYSTCSSHREENEDVVAAALAAIPSPPFRVVEALAWWKNPEEMPEDGSKPKPDWAKLCVRCDPKEHNCRGFFLCRLDRIAGVPMPQSASKAAPAGARPKKRRRPTKQEKRAAAAAAAEADGAASGSDSDSVVSVAAATAQPAVTRPAKRQAKGVGIRI